MTLNERIDAALDKDAALDLLKKAVGHDSVTGNEANFVALLAEEMQARGLDPVCGDFLPGRPNVRGERKGSTGDKRLLFIGHTDTVHARDWPEDWKGTEREDPFGGAIVDGAVWARGVTDLKGGIAASLAALDVLDRAGIKLKGNLAFSFVGDEESGEPGTGLSAGVDRWSKDVLEGKAPRPDFAVYVEPTKLDVYAAQIGFYIAEVTITGKSAYFGRPDQGIDALKAGHAILNSVWAFADQLKALPKHDLTGSAALLVTSMQAGSSISVPGTCTFSVIGSLRPGDDLDEVTIGFEKAVRSVSVAEGIHVDIAYTAGRDHALGGSPTEIDRNRPEVGMLRDALAANFENAGGLSGAPYWSEAPFLVNRLGCPAVYCGPGDIACCHTSDEHLDIEEYFAAVKSFALFAAHYCSYEEE